MITTTNNQIKSLTFVREWNEQEPFVKALLRSAPKEQKEERILARSQDYQIVASDYLGNFRMDKEGMEEYERPLSCNEYKAMRRTVGRNGAFYKEELNRLDALPRTVAKVRIEHGLQTTVERILRQFTHKFKRLDDGLYEIVYSEGLDELREEATRFHPSIEIKEAE